MCLWDIRQSGCVHAFDINDTQAGKRQDQKLDRPGPERVAHNGMITDVMQSPDGRYLMSAGTDDQLLLWDATKYTRQLVHYPNAFNRSSRGRQLSMSDDGAVVFFPCGSAIQANHTLC